MCIYTIRKDDMNRLKTGIRGYAPTEFVSYITKYLSKSQDFKDRVTKDLNIIFSSDSQFYNFTDSVDVRRMYMGEYESDKDFAKLVCRYMFYEDLLRYIERYDFHDDPKYLLKCERR